MRAVRAIQILRPQGASLKTIAKTDAVPDIEYCHRAPEMEWQPPATLQSAGERMTSLVRPYCFDGGFSFATSSLDPQFEEAALMPTWDEPVGLAPFELDVSIELNDE